MFIISITTIFHSRTNVWVWIFNELASVIAGMLLCKVREVQVRASTCTSKVRDPESNVSTDNNIINYVAYKSAFPELKDISES